MFPNLDQVDGRIHGGVRLWKLREGERDRCGYARHTAIRHSHSVGAPAVVTPNT
jgi:hypothetical protein